MIHVLIGPPCAGKTTYIREHKEDGDLVVDYDAIALAMGSKDHDAEGLIARAALAAREAAIDKAMNTPKYESWIIHSNPNADTLQKYEDAGCDIIELDPGKDVCLERAREDGRPNSTFIGIGKYYNDKKGATMSHLYKSFEIKADESGTITGYFSTYDREPDSYGDIIAKGAFDNTIKKRIESGHPWPLCWNHDLDQIVGSVDPEQIKDEEKGPLMTAGFFDTALAQEKREIVKSGVVYQFSFAYDVIKQKSVTLEDGTKANELQEVEVYEISIVPIPANHNAVMTEVKAEEPETKTGRRNSSKDEDKLRQIIALAQDCLGELDDTEDAPESEDEPEVNAAAEEPKGADPDKKAAVLKLINQLIAEE